MSWLTDWLWTKHCFLSFLSFSEIVCNEETVSGQAAPIADCTLVMTKKLRVTLCNAKVAFRQDYMESDKLAPNFPLGLPCLPDYRAGRTWCKGFGPRYLGSFLQELLSLVFAHEKAERMQTMSLAILAPVLSAACPRIRTSLLLIGQADGLSLSIDTRLYSVLYYWADICLSTMLSYCWRILTTETTCSAKTSYYEKVITEGVN